MRNRRAHSRSSAEAPRIEYENLLTGWTSEPSGKMNELSLVFTSDEQLARRFYRMVQDWRSWYLVQRCGEGVKKEKQPPITDPAKDVISKLSVPHHQKSSSGDSHYLLGTFNDLRFRQRGLGSRSASARACRQWCASLPTAGPRWWRRRGSSATRDSCR